jgi:hypothetical protein
VSLLATSSGLRARLPTADNVKLFMTILHDRKQWMRWGAV